MRIGDTNSNDEPLIVKESPATAYVDGKNLLGPVVGTFCMQLAIKKAKEGKKKIKRIFSQIYFKILKYLKKFKVGIGMVVANRSNHYGIAGYYSLQALEQKMIVKIIYIFIKILSILKIFKPTSKLILETFVFWLNLFSFDSESINNKFPINKPQKYMSL